MADEAELNEAFFPEADNSPDHFFRRWAEPILATVVIVLVPLLLLLAGVVFTMKGNIDQQSRFSKASREGRVQFQAQMNYLQCARDPSVIKPAELPRYTEVCEGYSTMTEAIVTERALQAKLDAENDSN